MKKHCSPNCLGWNKGIGTTECRECGNTPPNAKPDTEGPFMPEQQDKLDAIRAILAELPDETTPTARYLKETILPRLNRIREIVG